MNESSEADDQRLEEQLSHWRAVLGSQTETDEATQKKLPPRLVARTMVGPLEQSLVEKGHRFPKFAARLLAVRFAARDEAALARRLDLPASLLQRFEEGEIHPAWFPRAATASVARMLPSEEQWRQAIADAYAQQSPEDAPPTAEEELSLQKPWVKAIEDLMALGETAEPDVAAVERVLPAEVQVQLPIGTPVRRIATGEVGVVMRWVSGDLHEVSLPSGVRHVAFSDLEVLDRSIAGRLAQRKIGRAALFSQRMKALYLLHAYRHDEMSGLTNARVEPKPHQVFVAWRVMQKVRPRMILADEVGLGKTIEAGLAVKELEARGLVDRMLVVVPANLVNQWVWEFRTKFNIDLEVYNGPRVRDLRQKHRGKNVWEAHDRIICSLPFASQDSIASDISEADWDVLIFDEAHRVRRHRDRATKAYHLADNLRFDAYGMLLLTATPMQLDSYELFSLIELIEPGLFRGGEYEFERKRRQVRALNELMKFLDEYEGLPASTRAMRVDDHAALLKEVLGQKVSGSQDLLEVLDNPAVRRELERKIPAEHPLVDVMVRNRKADIPEAFAERDVASMRVPPSPQEASVYEDVTAYIREGFNRAVASKDMPVGFLMVLFQKMLTSSSYALARSFERRINRLQETLSKTEPVKEPAASVLVAAGAGPPRQGGRGINWDTAAAQELQDAEELSDSLEDSLGSLIRDEETRMEIEQLQGLVGKLKGLGDSKLGHLSSFLKGVFDPDPSEKVIIFTQFIETQLFLREALAAHYDVHIFNGRMNAEEKDRAVERFRQGRERQILISTEAGGEGRNFQFAHILVNYDLPWNPMRIEQRIGRIDRIGQKRTVVIRNLFLEGTLDERVYMVLQDRIKVFEESVGELDPILGDVEAEIRRVAFEVSPADADRAFEEFGSNLEQRIHQARQMHERLGDFIMKDASLRMDEANRLLNRRPMATHEDLRGFLSEFLEFHGGSLDRHSHGGEVITLSTILARELRQRENRIRGTFDPQLALEHEDIDFFALGHPILDRVLEVAQLPTEENEVCAYEDRSEREGYAVDLYYRMEITGISPTASFVRHRVRESGEIESTRLEEPPAVGAELRGEDIQMIPEAIQQAVESSEQFLVSEVEALKREGNQRNEQARERELDRIERIHQYRRQKEMQLILEQERRLEKLETGTADGRRLLPAIRGRINKAQGRLQVIELDYQEQLQRLEAGARVEISPQLLGAALVRLVQS